MKLKYIWSYPVFVVYYITMLGYLYLYLTPYKWFRRSVLKQTVNLQAHGFVLHHINQWVRATLLDDKL